MLKREDVSEIENRLNILEKNIAEMEKGLDKGDFEKISKAKESMIKAQKRIKALID